MEQSDNVNAGPWGFQSLVGSATQTSRIANRWLRESWASRMWQSDAQNHGRMEASHGHAHEGGMIDSVGGPKYGSPMAETTRIDESIAELKQIHNFDKSSDSDDDSQEEGREPERGMRIGEGSGRLSLEGQRNGIDQEVRKGEEKRISHDIAVERDYIVLDIQHEDKNMELEMEKWYQLKPPWNLVKIKDDQVKLLEMIAFRIEVSRDISLEVSDLQARADKLASQLSDLRINDILEPSHQKLQDNQAEINEMIQWMKQPAHVRRQSVELELAPSAAGFMARASNPSESTSVEIGSDGFHPGKLAGRVSQDFDSPGLLHSPEGESLLGWLEKDQSSHEESAKSVQGRSERQQQRPKRFKTVFKQPQTSKVPEENQLSSSRERNADPPQRQEVLGSNPNIGNHGIEQMKTDPYEGYNSDKEMQAQQKRIDRIMSSARRPAENYIPVPQNTAQQQQQHATTTTAMSRGSDLSHPPKSNSAPEETMYQARKGRWHEDKSELSRQRLADLNREGGWEP